MSNTKQETMKRKAPTGNAAALREALEFSLIILAKWQQDAPVSAWNEYGVAIDKCRAALATPPRNCDVVLIENLAKRNIADIVWAAFRETHPKAYLDVPGLLQCINWLFAKAEGGADEK